MATKDMHGCDVRACSMALQSVETDTLSIFHGRLLLILFFIFQNGVTMLVHQMVSQCQINFKKGHFIDSFSDIHLHPERRLTDLRGAVPRLIIFPRYVSTSTTA